ncbi:hypothetical protein L596_005442 [Steinernema carpocapsae]|nr:hypothetical protein L596_005442 [Steinernema carpocapsae]
MNANTYEEICECIAKAMTLEGHNLTNTKKIMQVLQMKHCQVPNRRMSRISTAASGFFERHTSTLRTSSSAVPIVPRRDSSEPHRSFYRQHSFQQPTILEDDEYQNSIQKGGTLPPGIPVNQRSYPNVRSVEDGHPTAPIGNRKRPSVIQFFSNTLNDFKKGTVSKSGDLTQYRGEEIMRKGEEDTELAQVLVGSLSCLQKARFVMVRLAKPTYLPELVDSKVPIRFLFVILGPQLEDGSYHELGRSIATLMANQVSSIGAIALGTSPLYARRLRCWVTFAACGPAAAHIVCVSSTYYCSRGPSDIISCVRRCTFSSIGRPRPICRWIAPPYVDSVYFRLAGIR